MDYDKLVFIGRMRPPTKAHLHVIRQALAQADHLIIVNGSCFAPRSVRNVWTHDEVKTMILNSLTEAERSRVTIVPIPDYMYADHLWVRRVQEVVAENSLPTDRIGLIGHNKDSSSYYLAMFPKWGSVDVENYRGINATRVREFYFSYKNWRDDIADDVPEQVVDFLSDWEKTEWFADMLEEYQFVKVYPDKWGKGPFLTADSVVIQSAHVLLIQRGKRPFKGLWALPGGFMNPDETLLQAALRELDEETCIDMPKGAIEGSLKAAMLFDDPNRDPRTRIISQVHLFDLDHEVQRRAKNSKGTRPLNLTKVKGGDDAVHAEWIPLSNIKREMMAFDHYHIITKMVSKL